MAKAKAKRKRKAETPKTRIYISDFEAGALKNMMIINRSHAEQHAELKKKIRELDAESARLERTCEELHGAMLDRQWVALNGIGLRHGIEIPKLDEFNLGEVDGRHVLSWDDQPKASATKAPKKKTAKKTAKKVTKKTAKKTSTKKATKKAG